MNRKSREKGQRPSRHRRRLMGVQAICILTFGVIGWRIHYVQQVFGPTLTSQASEVQDASHVLLAKRGALLDRNGNRLAYDVPAYFMDVKTESFPDLNQLAHLLSPALGSSPDKILPVLQTGNHHWVRWATPVLEPGKEAITTAFHKDHADDVTFTPTEERLYPYGTFAANALGFVDHDGQGKAGLEAQYNKLLSGSNGEISYLRDRWGFPLQTTLQTTKPALFGQDVELTIDQTIQGFVETKMNDLVNKYHPEHAAIVVTDPNTGEVLAMSSRPTFDPNQYWAAQDPKALSENWAVNEPFEPGSTFKALTLAAGLATHAISLTDTFMSGHMVVKNHLINDWNYVGWGRLNFQGALEYSSNVGFATVALKLGWPNLMHYMQEFGYLHKTGIDLPAEGSSIVFTPQNQGTLQLATSGFGQGIAVTPIQQIAAIGAIANGGKLMRPHMVKAFLDPATGKVIQNVEPTVVNPQVVPPDVVQQVNQSLILDVSKGIDDSAKIPGYEVAGKTGTANTVDPKTGTYYTDRYDVSFIGYAPGNAPKYEVLVTLDWPKTSVGNQWGSTIASPAARDILQECLQYAHISPTNAAAVKVNPASVVKTTTHYMQTPNVVGMPVKQAQDTLKKMGLVANLIGTEGQVKKQWPQPGVEVSEGTKMYLAVTSAGGQGLVMPDLTGVSMRETGDILTTLGLSMIPDGTGFVVSQSIKPGHAVQVGTSVKVSFQPPKDPVDSLSSGAQPANSTP